MAVCCTAIALPDVDCCSARVGDTAIPIFPNLLVICPDKGTDRVKGNCRHILVRDSPSSLSLRLTRLSATLGDIQDIQFDTPR